MKEQEAKWQEIVETYIGEKWACEEPCNSYAVCNNCGDAKLIKVGIAFAEKNIHKIPRVKALIDALSFYADINTKSEFIFDDESGCRGAVYEKYEKYSAGDLGFKAVDALKQFEGKKLIGIL